MDANQDPKIPEDPPGDRRADPDQTEPDRVDAESRIPVVGIGASAGGLQALIQFFDALPPDTGMAYVVVTHLHPDRESLMDELLQSHTRMPVREVMGEIGVEPDHVYLIPPNRYIHITDTRLETSEFDEPRGLRSPIDSFFRSLAEAHSSPIAIILSGGGSDGAVGIKAIKEKGGLVMVQKPEEAEFDSMPNAAISSGLADFVLDVRELAGKLVELAQQTVILPHDPEDLSVADQETFHRILTQVLTHTGNDFTQYKRTTVLRRIQRRMQINGFSTMEAYLGYLRGHGAEARALFDDMLIGVTNFFRDQKSWDELVGKVIPSLFENKGVGDTVRVWVVGCSTGEEAYGVAILMLERLATLEIRPQIQVFATDLDENALALAREGLYPRAISDDVSEDRLNRFFIEEGDHYRVKRELRDIILFSEHNVLRDPPFSRLDMVCCRNLLIYLDRSVQEIVFEIFHYALHPNGYLFLGSSESADSVQTLFRTLDKAHRIYQTRHWTGERPHLPTLPMNVYRGLTQKREPKLPGGVQPQAAGPLYVLHEEALEKYAPPTILVNEEYHILHISGNAGRYLLHPRGAIRSDLLELIRKELAFELRTALFEAFEKQIAVVSPPISIKFEGAPRRVFVSVRPRERNLEDRADSREKLALVVFLEDESDLAGRVLAAEADDSNQDTAEADTKRADPSVKKLEQEAKRLRERLQGTIEEYETSNEELKAANEEQQSINEEYRSMTEELETSKEELQSVNEELQTVNNELKTKLEEISRANSDLVNLMGATDIATIFLDRALRIKRYTAGMETVFSILPGDLGRPIEHLTNKLGYDRLPEDALQVLRSLVPIEHEVGVPGSEWFLVRLRPYRTVEDQIEGVVITFVNITRLKQTVAQLRQREEELANAVEYKEKIVDTVRESILVLKSDLTVDFVNDSFYSTFDVRPAEVLGRRIYDLGNGRWDIPMLRHALEKVLPEDGEFNDYEVVHEFETIGTRTMLVNGRRLDNEQLIVLVIDDITERRRVFDALRERERDLEKLAKSLEKQVNERTMELNDANIKLVNSTAVLSSLFQANPIPTAIIRESDGIFMDVNDRFLKFFELEREEVIGRPAEAVQQNWASDAVQAGLIERLGREGSVRGMELAIDLPSGVKRMVLVSIEIAPIQEEDLLIISFIDITDRVRAEHQMRDLASQLTMTEQNVRHNISTVLHDDLQQRLYAIDLQMKFLGDAAREMDLEKFEDEYGQIQRSLKESIGLTRQLSVDLSPPILHDEGLREAIGWLTAQMRAKHHLEVDIRAEESVPVPQTDMRVLLFQCVREVLFNVVKHAGVSQAVVALGREDGAIWISVTDQGKGFDPESLRTEDLGRGLGSLRSRLRLFGGDLSVESAPGEGTRATIFIPIREKSEPDE